MTFRFDGEARTMEADKFIAFDSDPKHFDRFHKIICKPDLKGNLGGSLVICASMMLAVQSFLIAAFGREEAGRIFANFVDGVFQGTRPQ